MVPLFRWTEAVPQGMQRLVSFVARPQPEESNSTRNHSARSLSTRSAPAKSPRLKINFVSRFNLIGCFGPLVEKFYFRFSEIYAYLPASRSTKRGASANRHERWMRDAMDVLVRT
jgi:hypothetical protein